MKVSLLTLTLLTFVIVHTDAQKTLPKPLQERRVRDTYVEEITYTNKRREVAIVRTFTPGGERITEEHYENFNQGIKHGLTRCWYPNGQMYWSSNFKHGQTHGPLLVYYPDGSLKRREYFKNEVSHKRECFDLLGEAQTCEAFAKPASFVGTDKEFLVSIQQKLDEAGYVPDNTTHIIGFQGVIQDNGQLTQLITLYTLPETDYLDREFTDKVKQALMQIPQWQSATIDDRPVSSAYVLALRLVGKEVHLSHLVDSSIHRSANQMFFGPHER